jgi:hypothetical protein
MFSGINLKAPELARGDTKISLRFRSRTGCEGAVAVRRTLANTICRIADPMLVARPRQLRDVSTVMRFQPAHQRIINRRHDGRASCLARQSLKQLLPGSHGLMRLLFEKADMRVS